MPQYDYACRKCHKRFTRILTLREHESGKVKCPKCSASNAEQVPSTFTPVTARKS